MDRDLFYSSYVQTYLQRDVRDLARVRDELAFLRFLRAAAARTGQILNLAGLAGDADVAPNTAKHWLLILQAAGTVYLLEPYQTNVTQRLVKAPRLYFLRWHRLSAGDQEDGQRHEPKPRETFGGTLTFATHRSRCTIRSSGHPPWPGIRQLTAGRGAGIMAGSYAYTPQMWSYLLTAGLLAVCVLFGWRRRAVPGARPFAVACLLALIWVAGAAAEAMAVDPVARVAWFKFQAAWQLPTVTAITGFVLEYANPGRWLTRRALLLLSIPPLLGLVLIATNDLHRLNWLGFSVGTSVVPLPGPAYWVLLAYGMGLMLVNVSAFAWLFVRSPRHRVPVVLMLIGQIAARTLHALDVTGGQAVLGWDPFLPSIVIPTVMYAIALFGFRIFDPLPAAGRAAIAQMREGMVVFDAGWRVVTLNPAAAGILGVSAKHARGKTWAELLPSCPDAQRCLEPGTRPVEVSIRSIDTRLAGAEPRLYSLALTPLVDHRALIEGYLLLLQDVTEQRRAQAQILEQQRALAMLHEREQLARELHDGIGQVLGFASLKTGATRKLIADGRLARADEQLAHLESIMADAHADVREYILNLRTAPAEGRPFFAALEHYVAGFRQNYDIQVELSVGAGVGDDLLAPEAQMQVFRIVQEAFSNVRKHASADRVRLSFETGGGLVRVRIEDNGQGFDPQRASSAEDSHFGLRFMRERAEQVGGTLRVDSEPGQGTCVTVEVPVGQ